jgi:hypothetical protein
VVKSLEHASLAARLTNLVGKPVELIGYAMPSFASKAIAATSRGLEVALKVALRTLPRSPRPAQLRRVGDDCRLWRARAVWVIEPCPVGYLCNAANAAAIPIATVSEWPAIRNEMAARVAPMVCAVTCAVASMPPAAPLRASGVADSIERLFGAEKKQKPRPHRAMRHASAAVGFSGRPAKRASTESVSASQIVAADQ